MLAQRAPSPLLLFSAEGALLAQNEAASLFPERAALADLFVSAEQAASFPRAARDTSAARPWSVEAELHTRTGTGWFVVTAHGAPDPQTGAPALVVSATELTERRAADTTKDDLVSVVSHELRTPLTAIRGALGLLCNQVLDDPEERTEMLQIAWENVQRLGRLVDDLLDTQRLRRGTVELVLTPLEVAPLVRESLDLLHATAEASGVGLRLVEPAPSVVVRADPGRVVQIVSNLVSNAVKHAPAGSEVTVAIEARLDRVRVQVRDEGPGVPSSFVPRLFDAFSQADSGDQRSASGAGLGLHIVRTLVLAHGGTVGYAPSGEVGAIFFFELPAAAPSPSDVETTT